jgi:hypothetical protein
LSLLGSLAGYLVPFTIGGLLLFLFVYVLVMPDKAQIVAGWLWGLGALIWRGADKRAVAYRVQGEVNSATSAIMKSHPRFILDGKLRIKWTTADEAQAAIEDGDVIVFMQRSRHQHENVAKAVMSYIPKAVIPRARRYVNADTLRAADLILAKAILCQDGMECAVLDVFYERYLDVACESPELKSKVERLDEVDVHGWLGRVLLTEYYVLGQKLHPSEPRPAWIRESEAFADWLYTLAMLAPGEKGSLLFRGQLLSIGIIFVARRTLLAELGIEPYRKRAKRLLYQEKVDAVYLMGRDENIRQVRAVADVLSGDALIADCSVFEYDLRADFSAKKTLRREKAIIVCLRRRQKAGEEATQELIEDEGDLPHDTYDAAALGTSAETDGIGADGHESDAGSSTL